MSLLALIKGHKKDNLYPRATKVRDETKDKASLTVRRYPKMASQS
jgi:hypothetical protein